LAEHKPFLDTPSHSAWSELSEGIPGGGHVKFGVSNAMALYSATVHILTNITRR